MSPGRHRVAVLAQVAISALSLMGKKGKRKRGSKRGTRAPESQAWRRTRGNFRRDAREHPEAYGGAPEARQRQLADLGLLWEENGLTDESDSEAGFSRRVTFPSYTPSNRPLRPGPDSASRYVAYEEGGASSSAAGAPAQAGVRAAAVLTARPQRQPSRSPSLRRRKPPSRTSPPRKCHLVARCRLVEAVARPVEELLDLLEAEEVAAKEEQDAGEHAAEAALAGLSRRQIRLARASSPARKVEMAAMKKALGSKAAAEVELRAEQRLKQELR